MHYWTAGPGLLLGLLGLQLGLLLGLLLGLALLPLAMHIARPPS
jgi:hypothetical protein